MAEINVPNCQEVYGNSGYGDCAFDPKKIKGAFQVPLDFVITAADVANLRQFLQNKVLADPGERIYPYHGFINLTDNTEDTQIETTDYGAKIITREGDYDLLFRYLNGGAMLHQQIQKNAGPGKAFIFYDEIGNIIGYKTPDGLQGIPTLFHVPSWRFATGSVAATYNLRFIMESFYLNYGNLGYISERRFVLSDIKGLQDVTLNLVNLVSNVATIIARTTVSGVNMAVAYSANLTTGAWQAFDENGNEVPVTNVAPNPNASGTQAGWDVTMSAVEFNAADKVYLSWISASELAVTPYLVKGFDTSFPLEIEAPGS
jgi:hypothetical protein